MKTNKPHIDRHLARHAEEGIFSLKQTPGECLCLVKGCKNESNRLKFSLCHKHYQYRWRILSPKKSTYATLRDHAKARGLEFTIDFSYFCGMADAFAYFDSNAEERGEFPSLDRIDATKGYVPGNIRIVTISQNSRKSNVERFLPAHVQAVLERKRERAKQNPFLAHETENGACPF